MAAMTESKASARPVGKATLPAPLGKAVNEAAQVVAHRLFRTEQVRMRAAALGMLESGKTSEDVQRWLIAESIRVVP